MFRILKMGSFIAQSACHNRNLPRQQGWWLMTKQRYYSKKKDDCPPCPEEKCKTPKPITPECKPHTINPCKPKVVDCGFGKKPLPLYHDCPTPNRMDTAPKLKCPHKVHDGRQKKKYLYVLIIGTIVFLITAASLYKLLTPPPVVKEPPKMQMKKVIVKMPKKSCEIPSSIPYLLIGGGTAAFSAFRAIKSTQPDAKVLVISAESDFPYMRPPLSKELWFSPDTVVKDLMFKQWNGSERSLFYEPDDFYIACKELDKEPNGGVAVAKGWNVTHIDVVERKAYLEDGYEISYDKCLIATGSVPKNLDIFEKAEERVQDNVTLYREIFDFQKLHHTVQTAKSIAIIGGGFLGSELACALARKGKDKFKVMQIYREAGNMGKILPEYLSHWTTEKVKCEGVTVMPHSEVTGVGLNTDKQLEISLSTGKTVTADHVIVSIGVNPNTELAEKSMLEVDPELGGYLVNTELQARSHLYIAGDCSCFYDTKLGRRRVEHHDHAVVSGRLAGENMAGANKPYWHQSMFWSDLGPDVGYEAIGVVDSTLPTVGVFAKATSADSPKGIVTQTDEGIRSKTEELVSPECKKHIKADPEQRKLAEELRKASVPGEGEDFGKGVVFYLRDDIVVGIVLWNVFNRMNIARQVLKDERKYDDLNEVAKLFNIHDE